MLYFISNGHTIPKNQNFYLSGSLSQFKHLPVSQSWISHGYDVSVLSIHLLKSQIFESERSLKAKLFQIYNLTGLKNINNHSIIGYSWKNPKDKNLERPNEVATSWENKPLLLTRQTSCPISFLEYCYLSNLITWGYSGSPVVQDSVTPYFHILGLVSHYSAYEPKTYIIPIEIVKRQAQLLIHNQSSLYFDSDEGKWRSLDPVGSILENNNIKYHLNSSPVSGGGDSNSGGGDSNSGGDTLSDAFIIPFSLKEFLSEINQNNVWPNWSCLDAQNLHLLSKIICSSSTLSQVISTLNYHEGVKLEINGKFSDYFNYRNTPLIQRSDFYKAIKTSKTVHFNLFSNRWDMLPLPTLLTSVHNQWSLRMSMNLSFNENLNTLSTNLPQKKIESPTVSVVNSKDKMEISVSNNNEMSNSFNVWNISKTNLQPLSPHVYRILKTKVNPKTYVWGVLFKDESKPNFYTLKMLSVRIESPTVLNFEVISAHLAGFTAEP